MPTEEPAVSQAEVWHEFFLGILLWRKPTNRKVGLYSWGGLALTRQEVGDSHLPSPPQSSHLQGAEEGMESHCRRSWCCPGPLIAQRTNPQFRPPFLSSPGQVLVFSSRWLSTSDHFQGLSANQEQPGQVLHLVGRWPTGLLSSRPCPRRNHKILQGEAGLLWGSEVLCAELRDG